MSDKQLSPAHPQDPSINPCKACPVQWELERLQHERCQHFKLLQLELRNEFGCPCDAAKEYADGLSVQGCANSVSTWEMYAENLESIYDVIMDFLREFGITDINATRNDGFIENLLIKRLADHEARVAST